MMPELAARGLLLISQFYNLDGSKQMDDLELPYPDLSKIRNLQTMKKVLLGTRTCKRSDTKWVLNYLDLLTTNMLMTIPYHYS